MRRIGTRSHLPKAAAVAAIAMTTLAMSACGGTASESNSSAAGTTDATSIRLGVQPWIGYAPWYIAAQEGYFTDAGVDVTLTNFDADADVNAALASGKLDAASIASHTAMQFQEAGVDVTVVLLLDASEGADAILAGGDISSITDLTGQKVAYEEGTTSDLLLNYALDANGMTIDDIERVPMDASSAGTALISGQVPVAVTYEPYITEALASDADLHKIYTAAEKEGLISDVLVVSNEFLEQNPDAIVALLTAWEDSIGYYQSDPDDAKAIIAEAVGSNVDDLITAFDGVKFFDLAGNVAQLGGEYVSSTLPAIQSAAITAQLLDGSGDLSTLVDASFVNEAAGK